MQVLFRRIAFLETVAAIPGMVGAMIRHLSSLRRMRRDHGWIHTLLGSLGNTKNILTLYAFLQVLAWFFLQRKLKMSACT